MSSIYDDPFTAEEIEEAQLKYPYETKKGIMIHLRAERVLKDLSKPWNERIEDIERRKNIDLSAWKDPD